MKKLVELEPSYYKVDLASGNLIYLSHAKAINENAYITITIKDIIAKIDALVEAYNALSLTIQNITSTAEVEKLKENIKVLDEKLVKVGDNVAKLIESKN